MNQNGPEPGEVWIVSQPSVGPKSYNRIRENRPFIITYVSLSQIGYVCADWGPGAKTGYFDRGLWNWHEHCTRIWPPVPSWEELRETGVKHSENDLRAKALVGEHA